MEIISGKQLKKIRAVVYGPEGIGKSTLASQFPSPVFIDVEGGTHALDVSRTQAPSSWSALMQQAEMFASGRGPAGCQTLVIDTADWAEKMLKEAICREAGVTALGDVAYGSLFQKLGAKWGGFLDTLSRCAERMHVVLLAHSQLTHCEIPEETGSFDRYEMKLNNSFKVNIAATTKEWASMVLFLNYEIMVVETDGKRKAQGGRRVCHTTHQACWDAKNRYGLPDKIRMPENGSMPPELANVIGSLTAIPAPVAPTPPQMVAPTPAAPAMPQWPQPAPIPAPAPQPTPAPAATPAPAPPPVAPAPEMSPEKAGLLRQLGDLMRTSGITFQALDWEMGRKGVVPAGTNPRNYNEQTLIRVINGWSAIENNIRYQYKGA